MIKKIIFSVSILLFFSEVIIAQRTVALHTSSGVSVFSSVNPFVDAYNNALDGDTIYLPGGSFVAPTMFDKQLYLFGVSYHPDSTLATSQTQITGNLILGENSDNSFFEGIQFAEAIVVQTDISASYMTFKRCKLNKGFNFSGSGINFSINNAFIECIILLDLNCQNLTNSTIQNSFIGRRVNNTSSNQFSNNIFFSEENNTITGGVIQSGNNNLFNNNIILDPNGKFVRTGNGNGNIFNNNLFVGSSLNVGANAILNNNYSGVNQEDIFVDQTGFEFNFNHDYNLQQPSTYLGEDGTQVGVFGGIFPFKAGAVPINPHISFKNISGSTNNNGELPIQINVNAQEN